MNPDKQIKALAELEDWKEVINMHAALRYKEYRYSNGEFWTSLGCDMPRWLTSYDAIIPLIQKQPVVIKQWIHNSNFGDFHYDKTPAQLCEALLRAHNLWEE